MNSFFNFISKQCTPYVQDRTNFIQIQGTFNNLMKFVSKKIPQHCLTFFSRQPNILSHETKVPYIGSDIQSFIFHKKHNHDNRKVILKDIPVAKAIFDRLILNTQLVLDSNWENGLTNSGSLRGSSRSMVCRKLFKIAILP